MKIERQATGRRPDRKFSQIRVTEIGHSGRPGNNAPHNNTLTRSTSSRTLVPIGAAGAAR
jgi:hypothetical protein